MAQKSAKTETFTTDGYDDNLMNISEVAEYLNMKTATLYSYVEHQQIPHIRLGKLIRFKRQQINTWLDELTVQPREQNQCKESYRGFNKSPAEIDKIVERAIAGTGKVRYTAEQGKQPASAKEA